MHVHGVPVLPDAPRRLTVAEALQVALDHAEEAGQYPQQLRQRIADLLLDMRIAGPWRSRVGRSCQRHALLPEMCGLVTAPIARVDVLRHGMVGTVHGRAIDRPYDRERPDVQEAFAGDDPGVVRAWCDEVLRDVGWALVPDGAP